MPVSQVLYKKKKGSARYDPTRKVYVAYRIDVVVAGKRHRDSGFASQRDAEGFIDRLKGQARDKRKGLTVSHSATMPRVSELFRKRLAQIKHPRIKAIAKRVFARFEELLEADLRINEVRSRHFTKFRTSRKASDATIRRELAELSIAFHSASDFFPDELEDYTPPAIKRPPKTKDATKHVIDEAERDAIVANLQDTPYRRKIARMFLVAWYLGLRYGEIIKLERTDLKANKLRVVRWKTGDVTLFEDLPKEVIKALKDAIKESPSKLIFPATQIYPNSFYTEFGKAVESAGLIYGRGKLDSVTFHSARHSFVTRAADLADLATVGSLSGHSKATMVMHYTHTTPAKKKELMRRLYGSDDKLRKIYDKVVARKMSFEAFKTAINGR